MPRMPGRPPTLPREPRRVAVIAGTSVTWREHLMRGIASYAHDHGPWHVYSAPEGLEDEPFFGRGYRWDGVLVRAADARTVRWVRRLGVPTVNVSATRVRGLGVALPHVTVDERGLAEAAIGHLLSAGYRRLAYCPNPGTTEARGAAFAAAAADRGLSCVTYRPRGGADDARWQRRVAHLSRWLRELPKPIGILTWNTDLACMLIEACRLAGVRVPEDAGILAGDNDPAKCQMCAPTVSALEVPTERVGYEAAALLDRLMSGLPPRGPSLVAPSGVVAIRQSTDTSALPDRDVRAAVQMLRERASQRVRVSDVAEAMLVSRRGLERRFRAALGMTPHQVLLAARLDVAKRLLLETSLTTDRVARAAGLGSASYLNHVFRRATSLTPARFRARYRPR